MRVNGALVIKIIFLPQHEFVLLELGRTLTISSPFDQ